MESKLPDAVDAPTAWVMRKAMFAALMNRRADAVSAADGKGPFLFRDVAAPRRRPRRPSCTARRVVRSAQVSATRTKGAATNLTYILLGYFPDWRVGTAANPPQFPARKGFATLHNFYEFYEMGRIPPHSVHDSVQHFHSDRTRDGPWRTGSLPGLAPDQCGVSDRRTLRGRFIF